MKLDVPKKQPELDRLFEEAISACARAAQQNLISGSSGNASFLYENNIYISGTGTDLACLAPEDFAVVSLDGRVLAGVPSKELSAHIALYREQESVSSVLHVHGEYIAAYTCIATPGSDKYPAVGAATPLKISDRIPMLPYFHTNIIGDLDLFSGCAREASVFMQCNHGAFVGGKTASDALSKATNLEANMKVYMLALASGRPVNILSEVQKTELFQRAYDTNLSKEHIAY